MLIVRLIVLALLVNVALSAQEFQWPEKPKNLQVLPKDWPGSRLRPVMRGFSRSLGVRCSYCHVGEEGKPLSTFDFASDANPNKDRAREMLRMLGDINMHLEKIQPSRPQRVNMWCHTCHRGNARPVTLEEDLTEQYRTKGIQAAIDRYGELKKRYANKGAYDFSEDSLNALGYELLEKDVPAALDIFKLNTQVFPDSGNVWDSMGEAYLKAGDRKQAHASYEKALQLEPRNDHARKVLAKMDAEDKAAH